MYKKNVSLSHPTINQTRLCIEKRELREKTPVTLLTLNEMLCQIS